jgi:hypothetical protein
MMFELMGRGERVFGGVGRVGGFEEVETIG